jgi:uncharacterized protein
MKKILLGLVVLFAFLQTNGQYIIDLAKIEDKEAVKNYTGDVNVRDKEGATPLMWAIYYSDLEMVKLLISKGANPYLKGTIHIPDSNALYGGCMAVAAGRDKLEIIKYMVEQLKISVEDREIDLSHKENGWTALQWAAFNGNDDIIQYLVKKKAKINEFSLIDGNYTALHFAVDNGHLSSVMQLVKYKAKLNVLTDGNETPLDLAINNDYKDIASFLYSKGAKSSRLDKQAIEKWLSEPHDTSKNQ